MVESFAGAVSFRLYHLPGVRDELRTSDQETQSGRVLANLAPRS